MAARYLVRATEETHWILAAQEASDSPQLPDGLRVIAAENRSDGTRWWLVEDDGAPATLEGKHVELTFTRSGDKLMIGSRNPQV